MDTKQYRDEDRKAIGMTVIKTLVFFFLVLPALLILTSYILL